MSDLILIDPSHDNEFLDKLLELMENHDSELVKVGPRKDFLKQDDSVGDLWSEFGAENYNGKKKEACYEFI